MCLQLLAIASTVHWDCETLILYLEDSKRCWAHSYSPIQSVSIASVHPISYLVWDICMYNICRISNTVSCLLPCTVVCMCSVVCTHCTCAHLVSFGYVYVMVQFCMYCAVCTCAWMYGVFILISVLHLIYSHSGLEGDQMVGEIVIIMQWEWHHLVPVVFGELSS